MKNMIGSFDEKRIRIEDRSYVSRIEAEVYDMYYEEDGVIQHIREDFEKMTHYKFGGLGVFDEGTERYIKNDSRRIRLTFHNGSVMDVTNSEFGGILLP